MKVSVNWLRQFLDFELPPVDELVEKIGAQLGAVEEVESLGERYRGIIVAKVVSCEKHPNADKLSVCKIDDGGKAENVERDENGHVQVVCGAPNVREGMMVAWLPPGSIVPESAGKDPFVLEARDLRGVMSNGMLASAKELAIGDSHEGILEIPEEFPTVHRSQFTVHEEQEGKPKTENAWKTENGKRKIEPGDDFAQTFKLNDYIIDIENKMFTHRPDCFGALGVAREIAGILHKPFKSPDWYKINPNFPDTETDLPLVIQNDLPDLVPRFSAITLSDVEVRPSPIWLQVALSKVGQKPINNIVDLTNFYMLVTGQPLHAYDYDKVKSLSTESGAKIVVRYPHEGEKVALLNGKEIEPRSEAIMIATDQKAIGLGGVMGGAETEVDEQTKNIILECANFDMYSIRRTSMAHGLFTDAVTRFNKGQSPLQTLAVLAKITTDIQNIANAKVANGVIDVKNEKLEITSPYNNFKLADGSTPKVFSDWSSLVAPIAITTDFINGRLGLDLKPQEIIELLTNVEFRAYVEHPDYPNEITVYVPFWRTDIEIQEDIVEEVGRLYGYDHLPLELPRRSIRPVAKDGILEMKATIRTSLAKAGANEVLTYSFVHGDLLEKAGQNKDLAFKISNALSPDLQYYRLSLTPSLLEKIHPNIKAGYDEFAIFELGKAHTLHENDPFEPTVPKEVNALSFVYAAKKASKGAPYYVARNYLTSLLEGYHADQIITLEPLTNADLYNNPWLEQMTAPYEPSRSAILRDITTGTDTSGLIWGVVGEFKASVRRVLKLPETTAGFEIDPLLFLRQQIGRMYTPLSRFPKVIQDITLKVAVDKAFGDVYSFVANQIAEVRPKHTYYTLEPISIYQPKNADHKNVTFRLTIASYEKTMRDEEVTKIFDAVATTAKDQLGAERV